ncbi:hypothetical protein GE09DRAFT_1084513 [Coniochaeta sp. 2T2.1]|nr:hypothetical protein GE09DRAFT_1084513 [Coniochaeta sp. 2T2.1]
MLQTAVWRFWKQTASTSSSWREPRHNDHPESCSTEPWSWCTRHKIAILYDDFLSHVDCKPSTTAKRADGPSTIGAMLPCSNPHNVLIATAVGEIIAVGLISLCLVVSAFAAACCSHWIPAAPKSKTAHSASLLSSPCFPSPGRSSNAAHISSRSTRAIYFSSAQLLRLLQSSNRAFRSATRSACLFCRMRSYFLIALSIAF